MRGLFLALALAILGGGGLVASESAMAAPAKASTEVVTFGSDGNVVKVDWRDREDRRDRKADRRDYRDDRRDHRDGRRHVAPRIYIAPRFFFRDRFRHRHDDRRCGYNGYRCR